MAPALFRNGNESNQEMKVILREARVMHVAKW